MKQKEISKKNYLGKMPSIKSFIKENQINWWIIAVFLLMVYGIKIFNVSISHDTEAIIADANGIYGSWYSIGRFGLVFLKKILGTYVFNPYIAAFLMVFAMLLNSVVWTYLFGWLGKKKTSITGWIFPSFFFTSMIMAEQSGFLLQAYEVNIALLMVGAALICLFKAFGETSSILWCLPSIFCCVIAFSAYQSLVPMFTAGAALCFITFYDRLEREREVQLEYKFCFALIIKMVVAFLLSFIIYQIANKVVLLAIGASTNPYITEQIMWGKLPISECIYNILRHIYRAYFGKLLFYNKANLFICLGIVIYVLNGIRKKKTCYLLYAAAVLYCLISPFLMTILMGNEPTMRTQIVLPFVMGFFLQYLVENLWENRGNVMLRLNCIIMIAVIVVTMNQSIMSARLYYTQYVQYESDVALAVKITDRIEQLNLGEIPQEPVVFIGAKGAWRNPACIDSTQLELIGHSFFEVSYYTAHGTKVMLNFLKTQGYPYMQPTTEQMEQAEKTAESMPSWPDTGSVMEKDGIIIVKLGASEN